MTVLSGEAQMEIAWRLYPHTFFQRVSGGWWRPYPHLVHISKIIAPAIAEGNHIILLNAPPRHCKSDLTSLATPTWYLEHCPGNRVIVGCHTEGLAAWCGGRVRDQFKDNPLLHTGLHPRLQALAEWYTDTGGSMVSVGVGGNVLGRGGNLIIVDDPHKNWEESQSFTIREKVWDWFTTTLWSRREPGATILIAMQRWHPDDLCGRIIRHLPEWQAKAPSLKVTVIRLPARAEPGDVLGRAPGEPLCPQRFNREALEVVEAVNRAGWWAMWQQKPEEMAEHRTYSRFVGMPYPAGNLASAAEPAEFRPGLPIHLAVDFNANPGVHLELGQYDSARDLGWTRQEIFVERGNTPATMQAFAAWVQRVGGWKWGELIVYGDRSGKSPTSQTADTDYDVIIRKLRELQILHRLSVPLANPPIKARVDTVNDALCDDKGVRHWIIHPDCTRLLRDLTDVVPGEDGLPDKADHSLTHPSDAEGYRWHRIRPIRRPTLTALRVAV